MSQNKSISYLELPSNNLELSQQFYETVFGWSFVSYGAEYLSFSDDNIDGGFYQSDLNSQTKNGAALIVIYSDNLEKLETEIVDAGGSIVKSIFSFPGGRRFHFSDPAMNELAVWSDK